MKALIEHEVQLIELFAEIETDDIQIVKMEFGKEQWDSILCIISRRGGFIVDPNTTALNFMGVDFYLDESLYPMDYSIHTQNHPGGLPVTDMTNEEAYAEAFKRWGHQAYVSLIATRGGKLSYSVGELRGRMGSGDSWKAAFADYDKSAKKFDALALSNDPPLLSLPKE